MKKLYWLLLGVPLLVGMASYSNAQPGSGRHGGGMKGGGQNGFTFWKMEKIVEKLAITPDQIEQLDGIEYKFQTDSVEPEARLKKARLELDHLLSQASYSDEEAGRLVDEITAGSTARIKLVLEKQIAVRGVLSPDQWSQLDQMRESRMRKMMRKGNRKGGMGRGQGQGGGGRGMDRMSEDEGE